MPTYEYRCNNCGYEFEKLQSIAAEPLKECPECTGSVKRLIGSGIGIIYKGSGFYTTDYKNKTNSKTAEKTSCSNKKCEAKETCPSASK